VRHLDEKADQHNFQSRFGICGSITKSIEILLIFVIGLQQVMKLLCAIRSTSVFLAETGRLRDDGIACFLD